MCQQEGGFLPATGGASEPGARCSARQVKHEQTLCIPPSPRRRSTAQPGLQLRPDLSPVRGITGQ